MNRLPKLAALLALSFTMFVLAACGQQSVEGGAAPEQEAGQEERAAQDAQETQEAQEGVTGESGPEAASPGGGEEESSDGYGVTTLDGEEVRLGAEGEATAIFFMAGW